MSSFFNPSKIKPIPWPIEPQFTSAPELWRHIIALETFDYPSPNKSLSGSLSSYVGSPTLDVTKRGRGLSVNGNNNYYSFGRSLVSGTEYTYLLVTRIDDLQATKRNFSCGQHNIGSTGYDMGGPYFGSGFNAFFYPVTGINVGGSRVYSNGDLVAFVCRYRSGETNGTQIWADGKLDGQGTVSGTTGTTYDFLIGAEWNTVGVSHTPIFFAAFDVALDSPQCKSLSEDPFAIIRQSNSLIAPAEETAGTTVNANLESLSLSANAANVNAATNISANLETFSFTENAATVSLDVTVSTNLESLSVTELAANVNAGTGITANIESLSATENAATVALGTTVSAATESINAATNVGTVSLDVSVDASVHSLLMTELQAQIGITTDIAANLESLTVTELGATIQTDTGVTATLASIDLTTLTATITSAAASIDSPGLEFTIKDGLLHYAIGDSLTHYTLPINRLHFKFNDED